MDEAFFELDMLMVLVQGLVVGVVVVEGWLLEKPYVLEENLAYLKSSCTWRSALVAWCTSSMRFEYGWKSAIFLIGWLSPFKKRAIVCSSSSVTLARIMAISISL